MPSNGFHNNRQCDIRPSDVSDAPQKVSVNRAVILAQVQAFLDAAEDVDIDQETAEDLVQTFSENNQEDETNDAAILDESDRDSENDDPDNQNLDVLDISALFNASITNRLQGVWTKQDIAHLLKYLKERGMSAFIQKYVLERCIPIPKLLLAFGVELCPELQNKRLTTLLYFLKVVLSHQLRLRDKLQDYNTIDDAIQLIRKSNRILILTGAGISVSCGIPDFRSKDGLYATLKANGAYDLDDPQQMFDISYFRENPSGMKHRHAIQIYPSNFVPSPCHRFIKLIEDEGKLLRNYTQNIDTLETLAGVRRVLQCHGSFATATCLQCHRRVSGSEIEGDIRRRRVPLCTVCNQPTAPAAPGKGKKSKKTRDKWDSDVEDESDVPEYPPGIMKPDITFFGEKLTDRFDYSLEKDRERVDLLLIIGTSLKVAPVADILCHLPHSIPQILINKTPIRHINPDIVLLGDADGIVLHLCNELGWELPPAKAPDIQESSRPYPSRSSLKNRRSTSILKERQEPQRVGDSHVWVFDGAEGGRWLQEFQQKLAEQAVESKLPPGLAAKSSVTSMSEDGEVLKKKRMK
ncbi:hypothetical protein AMATHDRAFT_143556 [Amanita thiersii Skay4041]|uniref:Deacetylase sirtuin-type domain-containing protein n=1 Tax=Amanita thiersii Skay4041 TaxID=703135 RepID=A0A2A9NTB7_9AGAR|nr:hypothetical protein AMATHDRAFT_143556 [Amanita thiersii Skay4041]